MLGTAVGVTLLALLFLVPLVGSVRDFLQDLPALVDELRSSDELDSLGDTGAAENVQEGANALADTVPDAISAVLGIAGDFFTVFLAAFTILFVCLFLLVDIGKMRQAVASVLMPGQDERWLAVWDRITESVSRWAIGVVIVATIAGTTQGLTAWLLGSSYALGLGLIAGLLDMIPNIGATMAGFILVPALWAEEGMTAGLIMLAVVLIYQQVENSIITPKVQGEGRRALPLLHHRRGVPVRRAARRPRRARRRAAGRHHPDLRPRGDRGAAGQGIGGEGPCSWLGTHDAAEADVARRGVDGLGLSRRGPVAQAVVRGAQM